MVDSVREMSKNGQVRGRVESIVWHSYDHIHLDDLVATNDAKIVLWHIEYNTLNLEYGQMHVCIKLKSCHLRSKSF